ncbi:helix-turn-helix transcriptional regulator [uncultured Nocardioides sp.]|uniref:helix-turn-helix transcriptional regulator n=1 Tax=uncultured Nocardioides sp. TaxID=198441 RepID=UPI002603F3DB|nr:helix-turn-helix transcriptional regulator [uncultured Nocardioides sp.]
MNETERTALARAIRDRRQEMELSARELARRAGVDNATIVLLEQGKIPLPRVDTVRSITQVLNLPLADIYTTINWLPEDALPSLRPYMRAKYAELSEADLAEIERFVNVVSNRNRKGPARGEDE